MTVLVKQVTKGHFSIDFHCPICGTNDYYVVRDDDDDDDEIVTDDAFVTTCKKCERDFTYRGAFARQRGVAAVIMPPEERGSREEKAG